MTPAKAQILCALSLVALWEAASRLRWVDMELLPPFSEVCATLWELLQQRAFLNDIQITLIEIVVAFVIAAPLALACGFLLGEKPVWGAVFNPIIAFILAVPQSVFLPLFVLALGTGYTQKIVFGVTHAFFVIAVNTVAAVRTVPRSYVLVARSAGATRSQLYWRVFFPAMLPLVLTGLRLGMIFNITGVLLAEMYSSRQGLGHLLGAWGDGFQIRRLLAGIVLVVLVTIALNELMRAGEARASRSQEGGIDA
jgi:NitT/TauT family transport system permease protein